MVMASPGAESVGHGRPQRLPAMAAIGVRDAFYGVAGGASERPPQLLGRPLRASGMQTAHIRTAQSRPHVCTYMPITHRERASVMHSDLTHTVNVGGTEV